MKYEIVFCNAVISAFDDIGGMDDFYDKLVPHVKTFGFEFQESITLEDGMYFVTTYDIGLLCKKLKWAIDYWASLAVKVVVSNDLILVAAE